MRKFENLLKYVYIIAFLSKISLLFSVRFINYWKKNNFWLTIMNILKMKFVSSSILITFNYKFEKKIILTANINLKNWKKIFMQIKNKKRHFCKYENNIYNVIKMKYDAIKRKFRKIFKYFKKIRYYLYDVQFILKIDAKILIAQFNYLNIDFFDVFLTYWIA